MINLIPKEGFFLRALYSITARTRFVLRFLPFRLLFVLGRNSTTAFSSRLGEVLNLTNTKRYYSPKDIERIRYDAELSLSHKFELLGANYVGADICWSMDFNSNSVWKKGFYTKQRERSRKGSDIKIPWELSRCHHLLWLGVMYDITKEEKYAVEIVEQINSWLKDNPFMYSVNWSCTMEVSIRAVNWIFALGLIASSPSVTKSFLYKVSNSLYLHGFFIYNNLEKTYPYSNNHYFSNIVGLLYIGQLFSDKNGRQWYDYALEEYYKELRKQILPSGVDCERSLSYHRLMSEMAIYPYYMLKRIGVSIPMDIEYRLKSMLSFIQAYIKPNGKAPVVEDNDDGRFLPFVKRDFQDHSYLIDTNSTELQLIATGIAPLLPLKFSLQSNFTDAGHFIIKNNQAYLFVTNGGLTPYRDDDTVCGTHTHNDRLSFELAVGCDDIIIDPGAYVYTADLEKHKEFRSTFKHNTVIIDGEEQNLLLETPFLVKKNSHKGELSYRHPNGCMGSYETIIGLMKHQRGFSLEKDRLTIEDRIEKEGNGHLCQTFFHLSPMVAVEIVNNMFNLNTLNKTITMSFICSYPLLLSVLDDTISPSYGVLINSKTIMVEALFDESITIKTSICWGA